MQSKAKKKRGDRLPFRIYDEGTRSLRFALGVVWNSRKFKTGDTVGFNFGRKRYVITRAK